LASERPFFLIPIVTDMVTLQTVVITGGSEGMGKAVACQLAEKGANVVIVARTLQKLQESMEAIRVSSHHSPSVTEALC
jgi:3-dehydrosphinganine reductase